MRMVLTDAQWAVLEPLIEACRPHRKTQHHHLRRTMEAIICAARTAAKWRAVPAEYGGVAPIKPDTGLIETGRG